MSGKRRGSLPVPRPFRSNPADSSCDSWVSCDREQYRHLVVPAEMETVKENGATSLPMTDYSRDNGTLSPLAGGDSEADGPRCWRRCPPFLRQNVLTLLTLVSVVVGIGVGVGLRGAKSWSQRDIMYVSYLGELFLRMLRCLILPLIVSSLVSSLGGLDVRLSGKIGVRAVVYYMATTFLAIVLGIILVVSIRPGQGDEEIQTSSASKSRKITTTADTLLDLVRNMFPPNIIEACIAQHSTVLIKPKVNTTANESLPDPSEWPISNEMGGGTNILGLVVFSVVLGITLGRMKEAGRPLLNVFSCLSDAMMIITRLVIWLTPIGVLFLVAGKILEMKDFSKMLGKVGMYTATVLVGLFLHGLVTLPLIYTVILKRTPFVFMYRMLQAIATAFGTSSSSATLPVTITCLEDKNGVDPRVSRFCLPIGATINMDGTALYEAVAAIFISQVRQVGLDAGKIIAISVTATAASIGAAGIPQAGLVTMVMVLNVVGLNPDDVALVLIVDWFLDRFRTAINVLGDAFGAAIVEHLSRKDLMKMNQDDNSADSVCKSTTEVTTM